MTSGEENRQRNRNWEGEESECLSVFSVCLSGCLVGTEEIRGGGLHRSNPTVEKEQATWPHQKPKATFIAHRLLLDHLMEENQP